MATKDQERKALEKIRKIVADLGECSYIGMAFEGCFEIAEENIENDFGCSMKQKADKAQEDADYFKRAAETFSAEADRLNEEKEILKKKIIPDNDLETIKSIIIGVIGQLYQDINDAAKEIVAYADNPRCEEFKAAVIKHRTSGDFADRYRLLIDRINTLGRS